MGVLDHCGDLMEIGIGAVVTMDGRDFRVRGFMPMSSASRRIFLEDLETNEWIDVELEQLDRRAVSNPDEGNQSDG